MRKIKKLLTSSKKHLGEDISVLRSEMSLGIKGLTELRDVMNEVIRMHELNTELLQSLLLMGYKINDYAKIHNIPFLDASFYSLLQKAESLVSEISSDLPEFQKLTIRRFLTRDDNRRELDRTRFTEV
jgi:hypothetical protein